MRKAVEDYVDDIEAGLAYREMFAREASWNKLELDYL